MAELRETNDGFFDGYEVNVAGKDPNDAGDVPTQVAGFALVEDFEGSGMVTGEAFNGVGGWSSSVPDGILVQEEPIAGGDSVGCIVRLNASTEISLRKSLGADGVQILERGTGTMFLQVYSLGADKNHNFRLSDVVASTEFGDYEMPTALGKGGRRPTAGRIHSDRTLAVSPKSSIPSRTRMRPGPSQTRLRPDSSRSKSFGINSPGSLMGLAP